MFNFSCTTHYTVITVGILLRVNLYQVVITKIYNDFRVRNHTFYDVNGLVRILLLMNVQNGIRMQTVSDLLAVQI